MAVKFGEGDWFALPIKDGGWALGLIARRRPRSSTLLGYFFGPRRQSPPILADATGLDPSDADLIHVFGYLGLKNGEWPVLGNSIIGIVTCGPCRCSYVDPRF